MTVTLDFDCTSSYGHIASRVIDALAATHDYAACSRGFLVTTADAQRARRSPKRLR